MFKTKNDAPISTDAHELEIIFHSSPASSSTPSRVRSEEEEKGDVPTDLTSSGVTKAQTCTLTPLSELHLQAIQATVRWYEDCFPKIKQAVAQGDVEGFCQLLGPTLANDERELNAICERESSELLQWHSRIRLLETALETVDEFQEVIDFKEQLYTYRQCKRKRLTSELENIRDPNMRQIHLTQLEKLDNFVMGQDYERACQQYAQNGILAYHAIMQEYQREVLLYFQTYLEEKPPKKTIALQEQFLQYLQVRLQHTFDQAVLDLAQHRKVALEHSKATLAYTYLNRLILHDWAQQHQAAAQDASKQQAADKAAKTVQQALDANLACWENNYARVKVVNYANYLRNTVIKDLWEALKEVLRQKYCTVADVRGVLYQLKEYAERQGGEVRETCDQEKKRWLGKVITRESLPEVLKKEEDLENKRIAIRKCFVEHYVIEMLAWFKKRAWYLPTNIETAGEQAMEQWIDGVLAQVVFETLVVERAVEARDKAGNTLLQPALERYRQASSPIERRRILDMLDILFQRGADSSAHNHDEQTPFQAAGFDEWPRKQQRDNIGRAQDDWRLLELDIASITTRSAAAQRIQQVLVSYCQDVQKRLISIWIRGLMNLRLINFEITTYERAKTVNELKACLQEAIQKANDAILITKVREIVHATNLPKGAFNRSMLKRELIKALEEIDGKALSRLGSTELVEAWWRDHPMTGDAVSQQAHEKLERDHGRSAQARKAAEEASQTQQPQEIKESKASQQREKKTYQQEVERLRRQIAIQEQESQQLRSLNIRQQEQIQLLIKQVGTRVENSLSFVRLPETEKSQEEATLSFAGSSVSSLFSDASSFVFRQRDPEEKQQQEASFEEETKQAEEVMAGGTFAPKMRQRYGRSASF